MLKKEEWGKAGPGLVSDRWPKDEEGRTEESAFLCTCSGTDMADTLTVNMLEAYEIPCLRVYPGDGAFGHVIMGASGTGVDIYVPKSMLEVAQKLIEGTEEGELNDEEL